MAKVPITNTRPEIFKHLLRYIYGGSLEDDEPEGTNARDVIDAANLFGVASLKLLMEAGIHDVGSCGAGTESTSTDLQIDPSLFSSSDEDSDSDMLDMLDMVHSQVNPFK